MIYQIHPLHGRHMAQNHLESAANEKSGWKTVTEAEFYACVVAVKESHEAKMLAEAIAETFKAPQIVPTDERRQLIAEYKTKFGEKPHNRMTNDTIRAAIHGNGQ